MKKRILGVHIPEQEFVEFKKALLDKREKTVDVVRAFIQEYIQKAKEENDQNHSR